MGERKHSADAVGRPDVELSVRVGIAKCGSVFC